MRLDAVLLRTKGLTSYSQLGSNFEHKPWVRLVQNKIIKWTSREPAQVFEGLFKALYFLHIVSWPCSNKTYEHTAKSWWQVALSHTNILSIIFWIGFAKFRGDIGLVNDRICIIWTFQGVWRKCQKCALDSCASHMHTWLAIHDFLRVDTKCQYFRMRKISQWRTLPWDHPKLCANGSDSNLQILQRSHKPISTPRVRETFSGWFIKGCKFMCKLE